MIKQAQEGFAMLCHVYTTKNCTLDLNPEPLASKAGIIGFYDAGGPERLDKKHTEQGLWRLTINNPASSRGHSPSTFHSQRPSRYLHVRSSGCFPLLCPRAVIQRARSLLNTEGRCNWETQGAWTKSNEKPFPENGRDSLESYGAGL